MKIEEKESITNIVDIIHPIFIENEWKYGYDEKATIPDENKLYETIEFLFTELKNQIKYYGSDMDGFANVETGKIMITWSEELGFDTYLNLGEI